MSIEEHVGDAEGLLTLAGMGLLLYLFYEYVYKPLQDINKAGGLVNTFSTDLNAGVNQHNLSQLQSIKTFSGSPNLVVWGTGQTVAQLYADGYTDDDIRNMFIQYYEANAASNTIGDAITALFGGTPTYTADISGSQSVNNSQLTTNDPFLLGSSI